MRMGNKKRLLSIVLLMLFQSLTKIRVEAGQIILHAGDNCAEEHHEQEYDESCALNSSSPPSPPKGFRCE